MPKAIISDASCFIILSKIGEIELLQKTYESVITKSLVATEFGLPLPEWIEIRDPVSRVRQDALEQKIDRGEASAIALALETPSTGIILDDQKARKIAESLGLEVTGTIGVIIRAKLNGIIPSIRPVLDQIRNTNFRLSAEIEVEALRQAGE